MESLDREWYSTSGDWKDWWDGIRYRFRTGHTTCLDKSCLRSRVEIEIYDKEEGKQHYRVGVGFYHDDEYIVEIWWRGVVLSLAEMLEIEF